ncbi:hypothetical protein LINPERHAP2_LOCUS3417, partial [Linum perenne]
PKLPLRTKHYTTSVFLRKPAPPWLLLLDLDLCSHTAATTTPFLLRFLPSNSVTKDVSKALGPRRIKPELIKESTKFKPKICPITPSVSAKPEPYSRQNQQCIQPEAKPRRFSVKPKHSSD